MDETLQKVLAILPDLQRMATALHEAECKSLNKFATDTQCVVDVSDLSINCVRIDAGSVPLIRLSGIWLLSRVLDGQTSDVVRAIKKGIQIAHVRLRWTLGKNKPRISAEYIENARSYRAIAGSSFTLPPDHFRTRLTVTVSDPLTGEIESVDNVRLSDVDRVRKEIAHRLTALAYANEQTAMVLDMMEARKAMANDPAIVESVSLAIIPHGSVQFVSYVPDMHDAEVLNNPDVIDITNFPSASQ